MTDSAEEEAAHFEQSAEKFFHERKFEEAFQAYNEAAVVYRHLKKPLKAAFCFSQAAQCEKIRSGLMPALEAATMSFLGAQEAAKAEYFAKAKWLFREAGLLYEREGEFEKYSDCFIEAQEAHLNYLWLIVKMGRKQDRFREETSSVGWRERGEATVAWILGLVSKYIWRYGEDPVRPFGIACGIVLGCSIFYLLGPVQSPGMIRNISFFEAVYMSGVTFTTVGYGDFVPLGWTRWIAMLEAFSGIFITPLFMISLTRRYLRVYR